MDRGEMLRAGKRLCMAALLLLSACDNCPPWTTTERAGTITDISFRGIHEEQYSKGYYITVPDKWFLRVCDSERQCSVVEITHAPWGWQTEGAAIKITWWLSASCGRLDFKKMDRPDA